MTWKRLAIRIMASGPLLAALACGGDDIIAPSGGNIEITTTTSGPEPDADGYTFSIDESAEVGIGVNEIHQQENVQPGTHSVRLGGMAANCSIDGDNPRTVTVNAGSSATVAFTVTCGSTSGSLAITAATTGPSPDPDGYMVTVDGGNRGTVQATGGIAVEAVPSGDHLVGLSGVGGNCQVQGDNPRTVTVTPGASTSTAFQITCAAPPANSGTIRITTTTTGADPDPDGYAFAVDGVATQPIGVSATATLTNVAAGSHSVILSRLANNCSVSGANPRPVTVTGSATAEVRFAITCTAASGALEITTTTTGDSPDPDGYTVVIDNGVGQSIGINATLSVPGVRPGIHQVRLSSFSENCQVQAENPRSITVEAGSAVEVRFEVSCRTVQGSRITWAKGKLDAAEEAEYEIYVMNADGSGQTRLTNPPGGFVHHEWSPDGTKIAFLRGRSGEDVSDIYVMNADGTSPTQLTNTPLDVELDPRWSPDGIRIAYQRSPGIFVMNSDGSGQTNLTGAGSFAASPRWSPDGTKIVFVRDFDDGAQLNIDIYVINSDGSGEIRLTHNPEDGHRDLDRDPVWSPDGRKIAFWRERDDASDIYVMNADGSNQTNLTNTPQMSEITPVWSPDGRKLALIARDQSGRFDLMVLNSDGTGSTNLTNTSSADEEWPAWSSDGSRIAFSRRAFPNFSGEIWVMDAGGRNPRQLTSTSDAEDDLYPVWSP